MYLRTVAAVVRKDVLIEMRSRETLVASLTFPLLIAAIFAFALELPPATAHSVAPGLLWVTLALAGLLSLGRSFAAERDRGTLDGLLLVPTSLSAIYLGKASSAFLFMLLVLVVLLSAFTVFLGVPLLTIALVPSLVLGLLGLAAAGTLFAALACHTRVREVFFPLLYLPVALPVIITATGATRLLLDGRSSSGALGVLLACDALYITASILLFDYAIEE